MPIYLSFLDDAAQALVAGYFAYERQSTTESSKRDARSISTAIIDIHTAIDKGMKHALSQVSPSLILANINVKIIQEAFKTQIGEQAPSIFASSARFDTHELPSLVNLARSILAPSIAPEIWTQFSDSCEELRKLRNQAVHGELFGEDAVLLGILTRVLSRIRPVMDVLNPAFLAAAYAHNDQLQSRLKGIENEIDAAWQVLLDYLTTGKELSVPFEAFVTLLPGEAGVRILTSAPSKIGPSIMTLTSLPNGAVTGLFAKPIAREGARFWQDQLSQQESTDDWNAMWLASFRERLRMGEKGLRASEDGTISVGVAPGWASLSLEGMRQSFLSVTTILADWIFNAKADSETITLSGKLQPGRTLSPREAAQAVSVTGSLRMTAEYVSTSTAGESPAGSTTRTLEGTLLIRL